MTTLHALSAFEQADMQRKLQLIADILTGDFDEFYIKKLEQQVEQQAAKIAELCDGLERIVRYRFFMGSKGDFREWSNGCVGKNCENCTRNPHLHR